MSRNEDDARKQIGKQRFPGHRAGSHTAVRDPRVATAQGLPGQDLMGARLVVTHSLRIFTCVVWQSKLAIIQRNNMLLVRISRDNTTNRHPKTKTLELLGTEYKKML